MIIRELFIDENTCDGCGLCWLHYSQMFSPKTITVTLTDGSQKTRRVAQVEINPIPPEMKAEAEWAIFECWQYDGAGAGSILGRGEPDVPEPD